MSSSILLVEDEKSIADVIEFSLQQEGFHVIHRERGDTGWTCYEALAPDLVLLDLGLPGIPGLELFERIRSHRPDQPVIMLTSRDEEADRVRGLEGGADDYVTKPFSVRELIARIRTVLRRAAPASSSDLLSRGPCLIDRKAGTLRCREYPVPLTATEFRLLLLFMESPRRLFSRDDLIDRLHGEAVAVTDRSIDAGIRRIRKKVDRVTPGLNPIETVYGMGYRLTPGLEATE